MLPYHKVMTDYQHLRNPKMEASYMSSVEYLRDSRHANARRMNSWGQSTVPSAPGRPSSSAPARPFPSYPAPSRPFPSYPAPSRPSSSAPGRPSSSAPGRPSSSAPGRPSSSVPGRPSSSSSSAFRDYSRPLNKSNPVNEDDDMVEMDQLEDEEAVPDKGEQEDEEEEEQDEEEQDEEDDIEEEDASYSDKLRRKVKQFVKTNATAKKSGVAGEEGSDVKPLSKDNMAERKKRQTKKDQLNFSPWQWAFHRMTDEEYEDIELATVLWYVFWFFAIQLFFICIILALKVYDTRKIRHLDYKFDEYVTAQKKLSAPSAPS